MVGPGTLHSSRIDYCSPIIRLHSISALRSDKHSFSYHLLVYKLWRSVFQIAAPGSAFFCTGVDDDAAWKVLILCMYYIPAASGLLNGFGSFLHFAVGK